MASDRVPVVHLDAIPVVASEKGQRFGSRRRQLGAAAGGRALGCSWMEVPPGRAAYPFHAHASNEEALFILEGEGVLRYGDTRYPVRAGSYAALPPDVRCAHQLVNTGSEPLRYLCISTMIEPEIGVYPDSGKIGLFAGSAPGAPKDLRTMSGFFTQPESVDYYAGERPDEPIDLDALSAPSDRGDD